ncbi:60 kDa SS-A Ro ribonucleo, partial [Paramuricea clavata]
MDVDEPIPEPGESIRPELDGSIPEPDESISEPDESIPEPDESISEPDESIPEPDESIPSELDELIPEFLESPENNNRRPVDDMKRLHRLLILGSKTPTYCIARPRLVREDARAILNLLQEGRGVDVVNEILRLSTHEARTVKQFPTMFALAICARNGDLLTKHRAYEVLPQVCRIPTHLFMFVGCCEEFGTNQDLSSTGWDRAHRNAMKKWYISKASDDPMKLAMDVTKYQKREGWSHRDVARLTHLNPDAANIPDGLFAIMMYIARGWNEVHQFYFPENGIPPNRSTTTNAVLEFLKAVKTVKGLTVDDLPQVVELILRHNLVREHLPTQFLNLIE